MTSMKISNYVGSADLFTWPNNPKTVDIPSEGNQRVTEIGFQKHHILVSGGGISPKLIVLQGQFNGSTKRTSYKSLSKHFSETTKLKKLYWETDKFFLGVGRNIKEVNRGGRTNFLDYVASFETILGILLDDTEDTSGTNDGNVTTFVTKITGTVTSGASDIVISDALGNEITLPAAQLTTGQAIVIELVFMVDAGDGIFVSEYNYTTVAGTQNVFLKTTDGFGILQIAAGANVSTISTANLTSAVVTYRDGWSA